MARESKAKQQICHNRNIDGSCDHSADDTFAFGIHPRASFDSALKRSRTVLPSQTLWANSKSPEKSKLTAKTWLFPLITDLCQSHLDEMNKLDKMMSQEKVPAAQLQC